jgi:Family of unknown function (DUF6510)
MMATIEEMRLDGNAVAGLLGDVFAVEMTAALVSCAHCGAEGPVAAEHVYTHGPGVVLRCPGCTGVIMRFARVRGRLVADLHGVGRVELSAP